MSSALEYWPSPPPWGWKADDLDHLPPEGPNGEPDFFKHVELIDGALVFMSPQKRFHQRMIRRLTEALDEQAPGTCQRWTRWTSSSDTGCAPAPTSSSSTRRR
ncbi:hypothetical protein AB0P04_40720, partial [Streptomyces anulatus]